MTPIEKAENALNSRIERIQVNLRETKSESAQQHLVKALVVCVGIGEALTAYVKKIGQFAQERHGQLKQQHATLTTQHAEQLNAGKDLLERFKAAPTDRLLRKELDQVQKGMETIQKTMRRGTNELQRDLAPSMAMIDKLALSVRRFGEADQIDALKRATKMILENAHELYRAQPTLPSRQIVDLPEWEKVAVEGIDQASADFYAAYAQAGYQSILALEMMSVALSSPPPQNADEATQRSHAAAADRLRAITSRFGNTPA